MLSRPRSGPLLFRITLGLWVLVLAVIACAAGASARDKSAPVILQYFENTYQTIERRAPDVFMAGYGAVYMPPPTSSSTRRPTWTPTVGSPGPTP